MYKVALFQVTLQQQALTTINYIGIQLLTTAFTQCLELQLSQLNQFQLTGEIMITQISLMLAMLKEM